MTVFFPFNRAGGKSGGLVTYENAIVRYFIKKKTRRALRAMFERTWLSLSSLFGFLGLKNAPDQLST